MTMRRSIANLFARAAAGRLPAWQGALAGAGAGLLVGLALAISMAGRTVFTGPYQYLTAGAAVVALWLVIGAISGLTVLSPEPDPPSTDPAGQASGDVSP